MSFLLNLFLAGTALLVIYQIFRGLSQQSRARSRGCHPPRSRPSWDPLFGIDLFLNDIKLRGTNRLLPGEARMLQELGTHTLKSTSLGGTIYMTVHPQNIQTALSTKASEWGVGPIRSQAMGAFCGQGFLTNDGNIWEHSRAMLKPSFAKQNISDLSAFGRLVDQLMAEIPKDGNTFDLQPLLMTMFIDSSQQFIIGQAPGIFGGQGAADEPLDPKSYLNAFNASLMGMGLRIITGPFRSLLPKSMTVAHWEKVWQYIDFFVSRSLDNRIASIESRPQSLLESVASQTADREEIRNQVLQGTLAAQDTTPTLISNTVFLLARSPHIWTRLRHELREIGADPTVEALRACPLLTDVLREYSTEVVSHLPSYGSRCLRDTCLPSGGGVDGQSPIFVPRGSGIMCHFYALHRNPEVFGADVEAFNPDRWTKVKPSAWEYMPFGGGQRACLGRNKALNEASFVLWRLTQEVHVLHSRDDQDYAGQQKLIAKNANGCKIACERI